MADEREQLASQSTKIGDGWVPIWPGIEARLRADEAAQAWLDVRPETAAQAAIAHFAETWRELMVSLPDDYTCHLTCAEAEAAAVLYRALGDEDTAASLVAAHAAHDDEGDEHYQSGGQRRIVSAPGVEDLEAVGNGPLLDADCRAGNHVACLGAPCECPVPGVHSACHEHERSQP